MGQKQPTYTATADSAVRTDRPYPPEAYTYDDDVTSEGIELIRARTGESNKTRKLKLIDGFGRVLNA